MTTGLIIFDCDGVLIDSEGLAERTLIECLNANDFPISAAETARYYGVSIESMFADLEKRFQKKLPENFRDILRQRDCEVFERELVAIPGIFAVLDGITIKKCVASSSSIRRLKYSLGLVNLWDRFAPHFFSAAQVEHGKPAPDLFLFAAGHMAMPPSRCLVIEDSIPGVQAARAAGMRVIGFAGGGHCNDEHADKLMTAGAEAVFTDMASVAKALALSVEQGNLLNL